MFPRDVAIVTRNSIIFFLDELVLLYDVSFLFIPYSVPWFTIISPYSLNFGDR
jgi:hypothetical protein